MVSFDDCMGLDGDGLVASSLLLEPQAAAPSRATAQPAAASDLASFVLFNMVGSLPLGD
jgi:hypothetical protein